MLSTSLDMNDRLDNKLIANEIYNKALSSAAYIININTFRPNDTTLSVNWFTIGLSTDTAIRGYPAKRALSAMRKHGG